MADYVRQPCYPPTGAGAMHSGWGEAAGLLPAEIGCLAVDGPAMPSWPSTARRIAATIHGATGRAVTTVSTSQLALPWLEIEQRTATTELAADPDFAKLAGGTLVDLLDSSRLESVRTGSTQDLLLVYGPGAALIDADVLWWADRPKRYAEAEVSSGRGVNLFQPDDAVATTKRLFYIDWPLLDRHRDAVSDRIDAWFDLRNPDRPVWIDGDTLRQTCAELARRPFRTLPTFNSTPWGGHWAQRELGFNPDKPNTALGYELIAPESGVLVGEDANRSVEIPFQMIVARHPEDVLGPAVHRQFGTSFPIRFDYLDTVNGGNLSVHTHPQPEFMREVFGWPYTQHESYYLMVGSPENLVFLGLQDGADVDAFHREAHAAHHEGRQFDITRFVQTFPATPHQLFLVPAGTPHGSGAGNVVLEVSATPYLYSLRFFDWLRKDGAGRQRPVHVEHAFRNLDQRRQGPAVPEQLIQSPRIVAEGTGWHEELLGSLPEMFFQVRRIVLGPDARAQQPDDGRFHVLTLVEGEACRLKTAAGHLHDLHYAETIAIPAAVGDYQIESTTRAPVRLVKANVA